MGCVPPITAPSRRWLAHDRPSRPAKPIPPDFTRVLGPVDELHHPLGVNHTRIAVSKNRSVGN